VRAVTLWQPWASLIALGAKAIETRGWSTSYRGPLLIHASSRVAGRRGSRVAVGPFEVERDAAGYLLRGESLAWPYRLPLGEAVAVAELVDVLPMVYGAEPCDVPHLHLLHGFGHMLLAHQFDGGPGAWNCRDRSDEVPFGDFEHGRFGWLLENVRPLRQTIPAKGRQGLWTPSPDLVARIEAQR
jgi:activating signal cointegrator 1